MRSARRYLLTAEKDDEDEDEVVDGVKEGEESPDPLVVVACEFTDPLVVEEVSESFEGGKVRDTEAGGTVGWRERERKRRREGERVREGEKEKSRQKQNE